MILPVVLALIITGGVQYFMGPNLDGARPSAQTFVAPKTGLNHKPINTEIDFIESKRSVPQNLIEVDTDWGNLVFSNDGASLESLDYKRVIDGKPQTMRTLFPVTEFEREKRCFMVAFDVPTPYFYTLIEEVKEEAHTRIVYETDFVSALVRKTFIIDNAKPIIDLVVNITMKEGNTNSLQPRIFFAAPTLPYLAEGDIVSSLVVDNAGVFTKKAASNLEEEKGWLAPELFGMDDRYFIHSVLADGDTFTQRAYYKLAGSKELYGILEAAPITTSHSWKLSFYFGPKDIDVLLPIEPRLEKALDYYGWFAPISKGLLKILKWLYQYFKNYGIAIIVLTLLMKLLLLPLTMHSEKNMRQQKDMQKKLAYIEHKYADNPELLARERTELMRQSGFSMIGGCLPLLLQIPIFFALSKLLGNAIELYQAPLWWVSDLSSKDPYYIFPLLIGLGMMASALTADAKQRMSIIVVALIFTAFSANLSAGLALYICINTLLSVGQTYMLKLLQRS